MTVELTRRRGAPAGDRMMPKDPDDDRCWSELSDEELADEAEALADRTGDDLLGALASGLRAGFTPADVVIGHIEDHHAERASGEGSAPQPEDSTAELDRLRAENEALRAGIAQFRHEAEAAILRAAWDDFCYANRLPGDMDRDEFVERMERAGLIEWRSVTEDDLDAALFASELGIEMGGTIWVLTKSGHAALAAKKEGGG